MGAVFVWLVFVGFVGGGLGGGLWFWFDFGFLAAKDKQQSYEKGHLCYLPTRKPDASSSERLITALG